MYYLIYHSGSATQPVPEYKDGWWFLETIPSERGMWWTSWNDVRRHTQFWLAQVSLTSHFSTFGSIYQCGGAAAPMTSDPCGAGIAEVTRESIEHQIHLLEKRSKQNDERIEETKILMKKQLDAIRHLEMLEAVLEGRNV